MIEDAVQPSLNKILSGMWKALLPMTIFSLAFVLPVSYFLAGGVAQSHSTTPAPKYITVPVYYLTDRNREGEGYGNRRRYLTNCLHQMYYGTAFVTIENHEHEQESKVTDSLGWKLTEQHPKAKCVNDEIDPARPVKAKVEFFDRLGKSLDDAGTDKLCVYVHGADEGFQDACEDAADLAYSLHKPLVLYSWPSEPKLLDYMVDNGNSEWSQGHFNIFTRNLLSFKQTHPLSLVLIAHSMGNRFIFRDMHFLYHSQLISDCEFISPDMDIDTCRHFLMGFKKVDYNTAMRLYVSNKDKMLKLSQKLFGGYARLGEDVQSHLVPDRNVEMLTVRKESPAKEEKSKSKESSQNSFMEANESTEVADVLQRIDFTAIDKGLTGHSIPFQLIADMVNGNKASNGVELIEDKSTNEAVIIARPVNAGGDTTSKP